MQPHELRRHIQTLASRLADANRLAESLRITRERAAERQATALSEARDDLRRMNDENLRLATELQEAQRLLGQRNAELERIASSRGVKLSWEWVIDPDGPWAGRIPDLTGIMNRDVLVALYDWVDSSGLAKKVKLWHHAQTAQRMDDDESGASKRDMSGHQDKKVSPQDSLLLTLMKLRTGLSFRLLSVWMGISYTNCQRIFSTWIPYLFHFFNAEFPPPTTDDLRDKTPRQWVQVYGAVPRFVIDATVPQTTRRPPRYILIVRYEYGISSANIIIIIVAYSLQDLEEQKRTKYKINGTATTTCTAIEKSNPNRPAKSRLPYSYQEQSSYTVSSRRPAGRVVILQLAQIGGHFSDDPYSYWYGNNRKSLLHHLSGRTSQMLLY